MLMGRVEQEQELQLREPFGTWLLSQVDRGDWIDGLAAAARADRGFPRRGDVDQVRKRMQELGADPDAFEALDDAELDWLSC
ncbi:hypothetical protein [Croceibacterium ferulae]|uniref:hypothetical protein n=1 Tax=Croceibacterium ferulae TaxID=1854641 RepID=UPI001F4EC319|nr:hypothetical protein [Croceibacterium ferulae]